MRASGCAASAKLDLEIPGPGSKKFRSVHRVKLIQKRFA